MDLILSRLGAKAEGNTHPFYPLMLPHGTIAQDKLVDGAQSKIKEEVAEVMEANTNIPAAGLACVKTQNKSVSPLSGPDATSHLRSDGMPGSIVASCKTEINDDVAVLMEANESIAAFVKTEPGRTPATVKTEPEIVELGNNIDEITEQTHARSIDSMSSFSCLYTDPEPAHSTKKPKKNPEKAKKIRKFAQPIQYKNYDENKNRLLKLLSIKPYAYPTKHKKKTPKKPHPLKGHVFNVEFNNMVPSPGNPKLMIPSSNPKYYQYITEFAGDVFKDYLFLKCINHKSAKNNPINCHARLTVNLNTDKLVTVNGPS